MDIREHRDRDLCASRSGNQHTLERVEVFSKIACVARIHRVTLATFYCGGDVLAADRRLDDVVYIANLESIARSRFAIHGKIKEIAPDRALSERTACIWKLC